MDLPCYFYFPTCYSESFPVLSSTSFFSMIHNFQFHLHSFFPAHTSHSSIALSLHPITKYLLFYSLNSLYPLFSHYYNHVYSLLHPFLEVLISDFTELWEYIICLQPKQPKIIHASSPEHLKDCFPSPMEIGFILLNSFRCPFKGLKTLHSPFGSVCLPGTFLNEKSYNIIMS